MIPAVTDASVAWMNYALTGSNVITIPLVLLTKERYVRSDLDEPTNTSQNNNSPFEDDGDNESRIRSSNVPYHVMQ